MKSFILIVVFFYTQLSFANSIVGEWKFSEMILDGITYPMPNPDLDLRMTFFDDINSRLFWTRKNEIGFCERKALYFYQNEKLFQKVTWVNPNNDFECQKDKDMHLGRETINHVRIEENKLYLDLNLSDKILTYVMVRVL
jgi:hypothetical protein